MLMLRDFKPEDVQALIKGLNDPLVTKYLSSRLPKPYTQADAMWWIDGGFKQDQFAQAIVYKGQMIGSVGVYFNSSELPKTHPKSAEIGYWLLPEFWARGVASKAVLALCDLVFARFDVSQIVNPVSEPNKRSIRVMEKCGFRLLKVATDSVIHDGQSHNEWVFGLSK